MKYDGPQGVKSAITYQQSATHKCTIFKIKINESNKQPGGRCSTCSTNFDISLNKKFKISFYKGGNLRR